MSISDIKDVGTLAALFEVDSNYGRWPVGVGEIRTAASALVGSNADADLVHWIVAAAAAKIVVHHRRSLAELRRAQVIDWAAEVRVIQ